MERLRSGIAWLMIICGIEAAAAAVFTVGDTSGWSIGSDYSTWASDKTFSIGDTLGIIILFLSSYYIMFFLSSIRKVIKTIFGQELCHLV